jgi:amino acid permease
MRIPPSSQRKYSGWTVILIGIGLALAGVAFVASSRGGYGLLFGLAVALIAAPIAMIVGIVALIRHKRVGL